jgi:hypothetical protein
MNILSFRTLSLLSSISFLFGVVLALIGHYGFILASTGDVSNHAAATFVVVAWSFVGASIIPEIIIDVGGQLSNQFHGRHGNRKSAILSWLQTFAFADGIVLHGIAMKRYWDTGTNEDVGNVFRDKNYQVSWEALFLTSSVLLTVSGLLAVASSGCCCCKDVSGHSQAVRSLVQSANIVFLCAAGALLFAISMDGFCGQCFLGFFMVAAAYIALIACGVLWIIADCKLPREEAAQPVSEEESPQQGQ